MLVRFLGAALVLAALAPIALAAPRPLSSDELDRVSAGATASAGLSGGNAAPQVVLDPPRNPRDFLRWLRFRVICALPGRVCIQ